MPEAEPQALEHSPVHPPHDSSASRTCSPSVSVRQHAHSFQRHARVAHFSRQRRSSDTRALPGRHRYCRGDRHRPLSPLSPDCNSVLASLSFPEDSATISDENFGLSLPSMRTAALSASLSSAILRSTEDRLEPTIGPAPKSGPASYVYPASTLSLKSRIPVATSVTSHLTLIRPSTTITRYDTSTYAYWSTVLETPV